jgi:hypothetical protein
MVVSGQLNDQLVLPPGKYPGLIEYAVGWALQLVWALYT